jgi:hypothetical protein
VPVASSFNPAVAGTVIESGATGWEATFADLVAGLTQSLSADGQKVWTGSQNAGGSFKITNMANGTAATDAATLGQVAAAAYSVATVGGTADAITLTPSPAITAYATGQTFQFTATGTNTTAVTVAVSGLTTKAVQANSAALVAGDIVSGRTYTIRYDGTAFQMFASHAAVLHTADYADASVTKAKLAAGANLQSFVIACTGETAVVTTGTAKVTFRMPYAFTVTAVRASLTVAQASGSIFTVDINEGGTTILSTKITIDNTELTSTTAVAPPVISDATLADDASITIDVDQVGNGSATGLKVEIIGYPT